MLAVDARPIEKFIAANEKQLHAARAPALEILRDVSLVAHANIDSHSRVFFSKRGVFSNLTIERQRHCYLMGAPAQFPR